MVVSYTKVRMCVYYYDYIYTPTAAVDDGPEEMIMTDDERVTRHFARDVSRSEDFPREDISWLLMLLLLLLLSCVHFCRVSQTIFKCIIVTRITTRTVRVSRRLSQRHYDARTKSSRRFSALESQVPSENNGNPSDLSVINLRWARRRASRATKVAVFRRLRYLILNAKRGVKNEYTLRDFG